MRARNAVAVLTTVWFITAVALAQEKKEAVKAVPVKTTVKAPAKTDPAIPTAPVAVKEAVTVKTPTTQPVSSDDAGGILGAILAAAKGGKWALMVGFIVMLLTWLVNKILRGKIPSAVMPWLAIGLSMIAAVAFSLSTGAGWLNAFIVGVQSGLIAAGSWSAFGKYLPVIGKPEVK